MVGVVHKSKVKMTDENLNPKDQENLQNLREMVENHHLLQDIKLNHHQNRPNDARRHRHP
jgi:hypothetical protein